MHVEDMQYMHSHNFRHRQVKSSGENKLDGASQKITNSETEK